VLSRQPISITEYYTAFISVLGAVAGLVAASPLFSEYLPTNLSQHIFPPLGEMESLARFGTAAFAVLASFIAFFFGSEKVRIRLAIAASVALVCFILFLALSSRLVRTIDIPSQDTARAVSVGFERSEFAKSNFAKDTDWEMLRQRGMSDEEIERLWTPNSVMASRLALWISCVGCVVASVLALSFGVFAQATAGKSDAVRAVTAEK
jgi:hypothetical protein